MIVVSTVKATNQPTEDRRTLTALLELRRVQYSPREFTLYFVVERQATRSPDIHLAAETAAPSKGLGFTLLAKARSLFHANPQSHSPRAIF